MTKNPTLREYAQNKMQNGYIECSKTQSDTGLLKIWWVNTQDWTIHTPEPNSRTYYNTPQTEVFIIPDNLR